MLPSRTIRDFTSHTNATIPCGLTGASKLTEADPATVTWAHAGSAAALANALVDLVNESR